MADAKGFRIKIDEANYQAVIDGMRAITWRSEESVFSSAINKTAKHAQVWWTDEIKKVYIGEWPKGVLARSSIKPSTAANVGATIDFKSGIPGLKKFRATPAQTPTRFSRSQPKTWRKLAIKIGGEEQYRSFYLGPQKYYLVYGQQRADQTATRFAGAFMATFGKHEALAWRKDGSDRKEHRISGKGKHGKFPQRYPLGQAFGSSDRAMADNPDVHKVVDPKVQEFLNDEVAKALDRALKRAGAK